MRSKIAPTVWCISSSRGASLRASCASFSASSSLFCDASARARPWWPRDRSGVRASASRNSLSASSNRPPDHNASAWIEMISALRGSAFLSVAASRCASANSPSRSADLTTPMRACTAIDLLSVWVALRKASSASRNRVSSNRRVPIWNWSSASSGAVRPCTPVTIAATTTAATNAKRGRIAITPSFVPPPPGTAAEAARSGDQKIRSKKSQTRGRARAS